MTEESSTTDDIRYFGIDLGNTKTVISMTIGTITEFLYIPSVFSLDCDPKSQKYLDRYGQRNSLKDNIENMKQKKNIPTIP